MKEYDVVIIGGGIHGAGVLQAAAAAGHSALLIERSRLAAGTSSRSSKLIHGGLRYLESGQFALVRESLRERAIHLRIAAELVEQMLVGRLGGGRRSGVRFPHQDLFQVAFILGHAHSPYSWSGRGI